MFEWERLEYKGFIIRIVADEDSEEPDWHGKEVFLSLCTRKYSMGREGESPDEHVPWGYGPWDAFGTDIPEPPADENDEEAWGLYEEAKDLYEEWWEGRDPTYEVFPFTCGNAHGPGTFSFWLMDLEDLSRREPDGWVFVHVSPSPLEQLAGVRSGTAREHAEALCECYEKWVNGEVVGFIIEDTSGKVLDSCWGFYDLKMCRENAEASVDSMVPAVREVSLVFLSAVEGGGGTWRLLDVEVPLPVGDNEVVEWIKANRKDLLAGVTFIVPMMELTAVAEESK